MQYIFDIALCAPPQCNIARIMFRFAKHYTDIYTASANITPAARDDLHGDICSLLPRERADMEAGGYICEVCTHSSFVTVHNFTLTQHVTQSVFHSVVVSLSLPPLSLSLSLIHTLIHHTVCLGHTPLNWISSLIYNFFISLSNSNSHSTDHPLIILYFLEFLSLSPY